MGKKYDDEDASSGNSVPVHGDPGAVDGMVESKDALQLEVALYVESISSELRLMARAAGLESLSYFLEMARIEASIEISRQAPEPPDAD